MQLRQPEPLRVLDDHHGGVRHVDAHLDDRRGDQDVDRAITEPAHDRVPFLGPDPTVEQGQAAALQHPRRELLVHRRGRLERDLLRFLDDRIDDVPLAALLDLPVQERHHLVMRRSLAQQRRHGLPSRRAFIEHAHVEVPVQRQRQRTRDWRGAHQQRVRPFPLLTQRGPMLDAEPVLFIDDGEAEPAERRFFLHEGMRAHGQERLARRQPAVRRAAVRGAQAAGQQHGCDVQRREQRA